MEDLKLEWNEREYVLKRNRIMRARRAIESVYSLKSLALDMQNGDPQRGAMSEAFSGVLRLAGALVEEDEIYDDLFGEDAGAKVSLIANQLFSIMMPDRMRAGGEEPQEANPTPPSKTSTRSRSAKAG